MCIIIDADVAYHFSPLSDDAKPVVDWIESGHGKVVTGGKNRNELVANQKVSRWLKALFQAGRLDIKRTEQLEKEELSIRSLSICCSNDVHAIALARFSGARLLFSNDRALHKDFLNTNLICEPRGHVYQRKSHKQLLNSSICKKTPNN